MKEEAARDCKRMLTENVENIKKIIKYNTDLKLTDLEISRHSNFFIEALKYIMLVFTFKFSSDSLDLFSIISIIIQMIEVLMTLFDINETLPNLLFAPHTLHPYEAAHRELETVRGVRCSPLRDSG